MLYQELNEYDVMDALLEDSSASWTYEEARALAQYFLEIAEDSDIKLDVVAVRCDWTSYTLDELQRYFEFLADCEDMDEAINRLNEDGKHQVIVPDYDMSDHERTILLTD